MEVKPKKIDRDSLYEQSSYTDDFYYDAKEIRRQEFDRKKKDKRIYK